MSTSGASAGFGLLSAATWGGSDFVGGMGSRHAPALLIAALGQTVSLILLIALCLAMRLTVPGGHYLLYAAAGGFEGALALAAFYHALSMGAMGQTAAFTGLLTAMVPVLFSLIYEGAPAPLTAVGLAAGCAAIWLITHQPAERAGDGRAVAPPAALLLGALAGLGFGAQLILFKIAGAGGIFWVLTAARGAAVAALLIVLAAWRPKGAWQFVLPRWAAKSQWVDQSSPTAGLGYELEGHSHELEERDREPSKRGRRWFWLAGAVTGLLDTAGNLFYLRASQLGRLDATAVICALYPGVTMMLAAFLLRERPTVRQIAGIAMALGAVVLLSI